jgi:hypothetical protein
MLKSTYIYEFVPVAAFFSREPETETSVGNSGITYNRCPECDEAILSTTLQHKPQPSHGTFPLIFRLAVYTYANTERHSCDMTSAAFG